MTAASKAAITPRQASKANLVSRDGSGLIGPLLRGSWRRQVSFAALTETELALATPLLLGSGGAALGWRRIADSALAVTSAGKTLQAAARRLAVDAMMAEMALAQITARLNAAGVTPLIFKGWSVARRYPQPQLRPYCDFDLLVHPQDWNAARDALERRCAPANSNPAAGQFNIMLDQSVPPHWVDMHPDLPPYYVTSEPELFARARQIILPGGETLLEPCPEDHLRIVTLHFLKHGGWRPLWLCDIALLVENAGTEFDWNRCLTSDAIAREWIRSAIVLAAELLGCDLAGMPDGIERKIPVWLMPTILTEWRAPYAHRYRAPRPRASVRYVAAKLASYWPNPISCAIMRRRRVSNVRPVHYQIDYCVAAISRALVKTLRRTIGGRTQSCLGS